MGRNVEIPYISPNFRPTTRCQMKTACSTGEHVPSRANDHGPRGASIVQDVVDCTYGPPVRIQRGTPRRRLWRRHGNRSRRTSKATAGNSRAFRGSWAVSGVAIDRPKLCCSALACTIALNGNKNNLQLPLHCDTVFDASSLTVTHTARGVVQRAALRADAPDGGHPFPVLAQ